jgi:hypothetical protein
VILVHGMQRKVRPGKQRIQHMFLTFSTCRTIHLLRRDVLQGMVHRLRSLTRATPYVHPLRCRSHRARPAHHSFISRSLSPPSPPSSSSSSSFDSLTSPPLRSWSSPRESTSACTQFCKRAHTRAQTRARKACHSHPWVANPRSSRPQRPSRCPLALATHPHSHAADAGGGRHRRRFLGRK